MSTNQFPHTPRSPVSANSGSVQPPEKKAWLLALLLVLFILPLMGGTYWMYLQSKQEIEREELQSDLLRARMLSAIVEEDLRSAENLLTSIVDRPAVQRQWAKHDLVSMAVHLREALKLEPAFLFVGAFETDGTLRMILPPDKIVGSNFSYRDWYHGVAANWHPYVSEVYRTAVTPNPLVMAVAVPLRDEHGSPDGILMATYGLSQLTEKFKALQKGARSDFYVLDQHGVVAASPKIDPQSEPVRFPATAVAARALAGAEGSEHFQLEGKNMFVGYAPVPRLGWAVLYTRPESEALVPAIRLRTHNRTVSFYLLLVYLATAVLAALLMQRQTQLLSANQALNLELVQAKEEAERSNKFKDQFLSTMSHELRTPLNAVVGFSDLLTEESYGPLNDRQKRYVNHIKTGGKHLLRLINDILDLSRIEAGRLQLAIESVPIKSSFADVVDTMRPLADKKSQILVQHAWPDLSVQADSTRFKQVLMNLLGNAIKFTPDGGKIELAAQQSGQVLRVEVRDSGPGIPLEEQQRIFEAFHRLGQTDKATEGTGLGLAITKRLVELQGGQLGIESRSGSGSCFYFTLPIVPKVSAEARPKVQSRLSTDGTPRILVVENDQTAAHLLQSQLISAGYEVVLCYQPDRAVEIAAELRPSAVTIDILMGPANGWELLSMLKCDPRTAQIPAIVVTIVDQPGTAALLGADEYIVKPVERATLLGAVERCLNRRGRIGQVQSILVVEDDGPTREFIAELLSKNGYRVGTAANGTEARAKMVTSLPELVILDLILPEVSGFQLLAEWRLNSRTADLPVFVLTSKDLSTEERDYIRTNAGALFHKQEQWQDALVRQLHRAVPPVILEKS
jgi:signal transduction histidine kinase/DNA-binding response OmpR family regulator